MVGVGGDKAETVEVAIFRISLAPSPFQYIIEFTASHTTWFTTNHDWH